MIAGLPIPHSRDVRRDALDGQLAFVGGLDEAGEQGVRAKRLGLELRMELDGQEPRMARQLDNLHELAVERPADDAQAGVREGLFIQAVEFVAMAMALVDD